MHLRIKIIILMVRWWLRRLWIRILILTKRMIKNRFNQTRYSNKMIQCCRINSKLDSIQMKWLNGNWFPTSFKIILTILKFSRLLRAMICNSKLVSLVKLSGANITFKRKCYVVFQPNNSLRLFMMFRVWVSWKNRCFLKIKSVTIFSVLQKKEIWRFKWKIKLSQQSLRIKLY